MNKRNLSSELIFIITVILFLTYLFTARNTIWMDIAQITFLLTLFWGSYLCWSFVALKIPCGILYRLVRYSLLLLLWILVARLISEYVLEFPLLDLLCIFCLLYSCFEWLLLFNELALVVLKSSQHRCLDLASFFIFNIGLFNIFNRCVFKCFRLWCIDLFHIWIRAFFYYCKSIFAITEEITIFRT